MALRTARRQRGSGLATDNSIGHQPLLFLQRDHRFAGVITKTTIL